MAKFIFESETCSRCGGSGHYSYCQMYGTTCFKCAGQKETLTKRGSAAQTYFNRICSKRADEIVVGDKIWFASAHPVIGKSKWCEVTEIRPGTVEQDGGRVEKDGTVTPPALVIECSNGHSFSGQPDSVYRVAQSKDDKAEKIQKALEYQAALSANGEPRKAAPGGVKPIKLKAETILFKADGSGEILILPAGETVKYKAEQVGGEKWHVIYYRIGGELFAAAKAEAVKLEAETQAV